MPKPTKKQTTLLNFIEEFMAANEFSPSYREIMRAMNLTSVSAVAEHIDNCVAAGYLKKTPGAPRSLEIIKPIDATKLVTDLQRFLREQKLPPADQATIEATIAVLNAFDS